jgi:hypothetical protein
VRGRLLVVARPGGPPDAVTWQAGAVGVQPTSQAVVSACGQVGYGRQRSRASAMVNECAHGQPAGRCSVHCRAERVSRPGSTSRVRRRVLATVCWSATPRPSVAVQRMRLWARVAASSQAALAANRPEGRCARPAPA